MKVIINNQEFNCLYANTFYKRLKGLMFQKVITNGLIFNNCHSIHTFFMKSNIDIIMLDKNQKITYYEKNVKRNRIIIKKEAYITIELPPNSLNIININDYVKIEKSN